MLVGHMSLKVRNLDAGQNIQGKNLIPTGEQKTVKSAVPDRLFCFFVFVRVVKGLLCQQLTS